MDTAIAFVYVDILGNCRLECFFEQLERVLVVADDVDLLAAEFTDNRFDTGTTGTDTCPDWVDLGIAAVHCNFCAIARLARHRFDRDSAICDLGDFELKEATHKVQVRSGKNDIRATISLLDLKQQAANALARGVIFAGNALARRQDRLGLTEVDYQIAALAATDSASDDIADSVFVIIVYTIFFKLTYTLHDCLTGSLSSDAAEVGWINFLLDGLADLNVRVGLTCLLNMNFKIVITHRVHDLQHSPRL